MSACQNEDDVNVYARYFSLILLPTVPVPARSKRGQLVPCMTMFVSSGTSRDMPTKLGWLAFLELSVNKGWLVSLAQAGSVWSCARVNGVLFSEET